MLHVKILILISGIKLNNNFSDLSYPVLIKNYIFCGGLWYNINCIFSVLQQMHQKFDNTRKNTALHEATWLSCYAFNPSTISEKMITKS